MYTPSFNVMAGADVLPMLWSVRFGHLVTAGDQLMSTALPFITNDDVSVAKAHFARANDHWRTIDGAEALLIVPGLDGYISPQWYPSKAEHAKVVPTWNYELIHIHGTLEIHDDPDWKLDLVTELTELNEPEVPGDEPWAVSDAPDDFINKQLSAIVGVQLNVTRIEAKAKLSQNKSDADRLGASAGLEAVTRLGAPALGTKMETHG